MWINISLPHFNLNSFSTKYHPKRSNVERSYYIYTRKVFSLFLIPKI